MTMNTHETAQQTACQERSNFTKLAVAAIDFGTTYSGLAYSFHGDYQREPLKILTKTWPSGDGIETEKTPTCILFKEDKTFHSFGHEARERPIAETTYAELAENGDHVGWRYFKHFKMMLMQSENQRLNRDVKLKDDQDKEMLAIDIFSASIEYLKNTLLGIVQGAVNEFRPTDIAWVLTVPAIWEDSAKQFMREAANKAGIENGQLSLALEPEAAAILCKEISTQRDRQDTDSVVLTSFRPGTKFFILDLGGGTVDITVEMVEQNGNLIEIWHPDGGPWGGTLVDQAFKKFLIKILGEEPLKDLSDKYKSDELFLYRNFELHKRKVDRQTSQTRVLRIPSSLVECARGAKEFRNKIQQSQYSGKVTLKSNDKLAIDDSVIKDMFTKPKDNILHQVNLLFEKSWIRDINFLILVGGFSESAFIVNEVRNAFPSKHVIVPPAPSLAVLKGAVLYGHNPQSVTSRKMAYTYGVSTALPFDNTWHPKEKRVTVGGVDKCKDIFEIFFEVGQTVTQGETRKTHRFITRGVYGTTPVEIYKTRNQCPKFVSDEGCCKVGKVELELEGGGSKEVEVTFLAGGTELHVQAKQCATNNMISAKFDFLR